MRRWFPSLLLSASLWALWLLLNDSLSPAHLILGGVIGLAVPVLVAPLKPAGGPLRRPLVLARLILTVGHDVIQSALQVAHGVLRGRRQPPRGSFVTIPLDLHDPFGLAALSMITTVIPGTVWSELAGDSSALRLHVFDLADEAEFVAFYKNRYERPLKEIFG
ncbi:Na+/H+ antiporter subunit E [Ramlibacter sp.]|uniref:Na+/H+ antiporter subunit E n=1 Tax=Ramlibacter sp. TaxID=1917967 RepID=UPI002D330A38|nr:Na+/H+ antiporter subunit E [Ramlibacter sp.]HYD74424.1 Na+/H+ antiporter subunit E [Ramlibacter sp.]